MNYDVIIIGAGVVGAQTARLLSKYKLNILVLEKENDVCDGASGANSAIIHSGYDPVPGTLKARLNVLGNAMYDQICEDLDVEFERIGSLTLSNTLEEDEMLLELMNRAKQNNVEVELLSQESLRKLEPNVTKQARMALYAKTAGIINPFELVVALMENAMDNGVELHLEEPVINIEKENDLFKVITPKNEYLTNYIVNASGVYSDQINELINPKSFTIIPTKGEYYVLDHFDNNYIKHTLFNVPSKKGKGVLVSPTTHYNYLVGPSSDKILSKDDLSHNQETLFDVKNKAYSLVDNLRIDQQIKQFSGLRAVSDTGDFVIEETSPHFINAAGIQSPGLASSPAIAVMIADMIKEKVEKENFNPKRRPLYRLNKKTLEERQQLIKENKSLGYIICRCEQISEGEIIDVINRNCGATTIKGVKKRIRPGFGKCQGGFCESYVLEILSRELKTKKENIKYSNTGSYILTGHTKGE